MGKSVKETDRYAVYIAGYYSQHKCHPIPAEIGRGLGVSRQAVRNYFKKNQATLEKIPEYMRYFS